MKCPLLQMGAVAHFGETEPIHLECLKEECAWWNEAEQECAILSLAKWPPFLINQVSAIGKKMPHEEQFRR